MSSYLFYGIAALAISCYAVLPVISKKMQISLPPFTFIAITMAILALFAFFASLIYERSFHIQSLRPSQMALLLLFGAVNFVGFVLFLKAISGIPVSHYQLIGIIGPVVTAFLALVFLGEAVNARFFLALPIILLGLYIAIAR